MGMRRGVLSFPATLLRPSLPQAPADCREFSAPGRVAVSGGERPLLLSVLLSAEGGSLLSAGWQLPLRSAWALSL